MLKLWNILQPLPCYAGGVHKHIHIAGYVTVYYRVRRNIIKPN